MLIALSDFKKDLYGSFFVLIKMEIRELSKSQI